MVDGLTFQDKGRDDGVQAEDFLLGKRDPLPGFRKSVPVFLLSENRSVKTLFRSTFLKIRATITDVRRILQASAFIFNKIRTILVTLCAAPAKRAVAGA